MKAMDKIIIKTPEEIEIMKECGKKLAKIKNVLKDYIKEGVSAKFIDEIAEDLISKEGGKPSFKMVPGYHWSVCVNVNEGVVHGVPKTEVVFKKGDVVSIDIGLFYKGFHTDSAFTQGIEVNEKIKKFLNTGVLALKSAINQARPGRRIYDVSSTIESIISSSSYSPIKALVGHGVGKSLHEGPQIPCFTDGIDKESPEIVEGMTLAIEVMYAEGHSDVKLAEDGWTIETVDGTISALFEETIAVTQDGPIVLTNLSKS